MPCSGCHVVACAGYLVASSCAVVRALRDPASSSGQFEWFMEAEISPQSLCVSIGCPNGRASELGRSSAVLKTVGPRF